jgi:KaiC/GvpD/RAD55 family RecA-like ATPase
MEHIRIGVEWFDELLPDGFPSHSSTLISGPGGSGKPLIGFAIVSAWLRQGGSAVFMALQYPNRGFVSESMRLVMQLDLAEYAARTVFIEFDPAIEEMEVPQGNGFKANLVKPDVWDNAIQRACSMVPDEGPGILVFGSALNLLLFSPTYSGDTFERMKATLAEDKRRTYVFSVSTKPKPEKIELLEAAADNLVMSRKAKAEFLLYMNIERMKGVRYVADEIEVPIPSELLAQVKKMADHSRQRVIPLVMEL